MLRAALGPQMLITTGRLRIGPVIVGRGRRTAPAAFAGPDLPITGRPRARQVGDRRVGTRSR